LLSVFIFELIERILVMGEDFEYEEDCNLEEDDFDDPRRDPAINDSIKDMEEEEKAFPEDKE
jgi:hypothetical protein